VKFHLPNRNQETNIILIKRLHENIKFQKPQAKAPPFRPFRRLWSAYTYTYTRFQISLSPGRVTFGFVIQDISLMKEKKRCIF